jgi:hypothetical protein
MEESIGDPSKLEESTGDSSKLEDQAISTDVNSIIPVCAVKPEPEMEPEITKPVHAQKETTIDEIAISRLPSSSLSTEQQVACDAVNRPCLLMVPAATSELTAQDVEHVEQHVHQEAPRPKLGDR